MDTIFYKTIAEAADFVVRELHGQIRMATPLGLGKPNQLLNAIYDKAKTNSQISLKIHTALSLEVPEAKSTLEKKFLKPFADRHFGKDYPEINYVKDLHHNKVPANIQIHEFYVQAAKLIHVENAQRNYISLNYTHVAQSILDHDINIIVQLISKKGSQYSLSCNPDLTLDVADLYAKANKKLYMVGVVHPDLPFTGGDAIVPQEFFDVIVESSEVSHKLFALPRVPIKNTDAMIGFYASQLVKDDGTLQIGIGSLSDALTYSLIVRHQQNEIYKNISADIWQTKPKPLAIENSIFEKGLYGTSEMVMDGFMYLRQAHILKREVKDYGDKPNRYLHGAFFLGSTPLYDWLKNLSPKDFDGLCMTRVSRVNDLYDEDEMILRKQRKNARFFNTCMNVTLLGGAASDTREDGQVVSGVGGQYNFVAMSHELPDSQSILMMKATRFLKGKKISNIVWSHGQITIPRHLRDIVITEYGIANLRGKSDEDVIKALIQIADADFQEDLSNTAKKFGKLSKDYKIPNWAKENTPQKVAGILKKYRAQKLFPTFPFGSDFTPTEQKLVQALGVLKIAQQSKAKIISMVLSGMKIKKTLFKEELERMELFHPKNMSEWIYQKLILSALHNQN